MDIIQFFSYSFHIFVQKKKNFNQKLSDMPFLMDNIKEQPYQYQIKIRQI